MKDIIETLYPMGATLLGAGYDNALTWLSQLIKLDIVEIPSGTKLGQWTVPDEWVARDAYVKLNGEKIVDYKKQPLSLVVYSQPVRKTVDIKELKNHLITNANKADATPYAYRFYEKDWGFTMPYNQSLLLAEGEYEVVIDTEFRPGKMKIGIHTIPGKTKREILLFAHLDHPYQANDNLSGVACLADLAKSLKSDYTIKIIFCPETIGSIAYAKTQDISNVEFVIAVDICGNTNSTLLQKAFDKNHRLNRVAHTTVRSIGDFRVADFRALLGSDEYFFNDPKVGIPGILFSTFPYAEYHTSEDTPDKINYESIKNVQTAIKKTIENYEKDFIPKRMFDGPVMRSKYGIQSPDKRTNLYLDYFFYFMDGTRYLSELCTQYDIDFEQALGFISKMEKDGQIVRADAGKVPVKKTAK